MQRSVVLNRLIAFLRSNRSEPAVDPIYVAAPAAEMFAKKAAIVAGGAGKIGSAVVHELLAQGAHVTALDRDAAALEALVKQADCSRLNKICLDLTDAAAVNGISVKGCDFLIHAAGVQFEADSLSDTDEQWSASLETNVAGPVRLTRKLVPLLAKSGGNIVLITSIHSELPSRWANYSAVKAAQTAIMREWAVDLAPRGVRVNAVAPGWVDPEPQQSKLALLHNRTIPPEFIARAVSVLACEYHSRFTTGSVMTIDAGASLYSGRVPFDLPTGPDA